ncbi:MAG: beta-ketoacyl-ACP synthase 3 [Pirellulaceae bacterium]|nr:beta-ketoacyl-ACP synthase 3 [Pirellulaceae bacterium]
MDAQQKQILYRQMLTARLVDQVERELTARGEAFFHVSGGGHEASAVLARHLTSHDWLHCHYRDKALMIARGLTAADFLTSLLCKQTSHSRGRQMSAHMSSAELRLLSLTGPVGNSALHAVGVAEVIRDEKTRPLVLCSVGDGTTQEGEFLEACGEAVRSQLPVLFFVEDNRWAISTTTRGKTIYDHPAGPADQFYGMPVVRVDGRDVCQADGPLSDAIARIRQHRGPELVVFDVERLDSHTNADDQSIYRTASEILEASAEGDPLRILADHLLREGLAREQLDELHRQVLAEVREAERAALEAADPVPALSAKRPIRVELTHPSRERTGDPQHPGAKLTMKDALGAVLRHHLQQDPRVTLYGEDIEDPKGDVFGITKGLSSRFPGRVCNSPLSESTIIGKSIGRALAGERPVAFLQFADFLPLAYNQLAMELASMHWRTDGHWQAPVIVMVPCGGYRPGLGPFHSHSLESVMAHTPGLDVFMPSTATDAAGMLNAAFQSGRPTLFFYPKSCLNDPQRATSADVERQFVPIGRARKVRAGRDITFVGWGNTVRLCERAAEALDKAGVESEILDLRSLSPWDEHAVLASAEKTARLVVVHEDNHTCGVGAEVLATVAEKTRVPVAMRRVARPDTLIPCHFGNQIEVLPSLKRLLTTAADLLNLDLTWTEPPREEEGVAYIEAIGSGPSDETVIVAELLVGVGDRVERGDAVASLEATKSVFELQASVTGTVVELLAAEGETVDVGRPLMRLETAAPVHRKPVTQEQPGTPVLTRRKTTATLHLPRRSEDRRAFDVGISAVASISGSLKVTNQDLLLKGVPMNDEDILRRTGIASRHWAADGEDAINLAVQACWKALDQEGLLLDDIDLLICSTTSPTSVTPSMACQVLNALTSERGGAMLQAYDINAACSGYLYALQAGYDYLQSTPHGRVLVVTAEVLSPLLDPHDFETAILFGDATSATVLYGEAHFDQAKARLHRPDLSAKGEDGSSLSVPFRHDGFIQMKGRKVFGEAVRSMIASLTRTCERQGLSVHDLRMVVPHQANQRILDAIEHRLGLTVYSNIRDHGNTSSSSIPLCLSEILPRAQKGDRLGLCAFGGGFTFGAGILEC